MWTGEGEGKILYVHTHGVNDPGRCATPFFLAASAAAMWRATPQARQGETNSTLNHGRS